MRITRSNSASECSPRCCSWPPPFSSSTSINMRTTAARAAAAAGPRNSLRRSHAVRRRLRGSETCLEGLNRRRARQGTPFLRYFRFASGSFIGLPMAALHTAHSSRLAQAKVWPRYNDCKRAVCLKSPMLQRCDHVRYQAHIPARDGITGRCTDARQPTPPPSSPVRVI